MIEFKHVSLRYHYDEYAILKDLTFTCCDGVNTILCDTQSGKTSICKLLTKQFKPTSGQIFVNGNDIESITNEALGILYLPNNPPFFVNRCVSYNVTYPLKVRKVLKTERKKIFESLKTRFNLPEGNVKIGKIPQNELKRIALARGSTVKRKIIVLDDFCNCTEDLEEITRIFGNVTVIMLTSNIELAQGNVIVLDGGYTVYQGDADGAVKCKSGLSWIADIDNFEC